MTLCALARSGHVPGDRRWLQATWRQVLLRRAALKPQELTNCMWALAKMHCHPGAPLGCPLSLRQDAAPEAKHGVAPPPRTLFLAFGAEGCKGFKHQRAKKAKAQAPHAVLPSALAGRRRRGAASAGA